MDEQEQKDFDTTERIMKQIFTSYNATAELNKNESFAPVDAYMNVKKGKKEKWYSVEIKERKQDMDIYDTLPLKVSKYINVMEASKGITPLVIYLLNDEEYYIFNLNDIDLNKVKLKLWNIAKVQYCEKQEFEEKPTFFIPISMAKYNGIIPNEEQTRLRQDKFYRIISSIKRFISHTIYKQNAFQCPTEAILSL